jgi:hypothetical protein
MFIPLRPMAGQREMRLYLSLTVVQICVADRSPWRLVEDKSLEEFRNRPHPEPLFSPTYGGSVARTLPKPTLPNNLRRKLRYLPPFQESVKQNLDVKEELRRQYLVNKKFGSGRSTLVKKHFLTASVFLGRESRYHPSGLADSLSS